MNTPLFQGKLVRLLAPDPQRDATLFASWSRDDEYLRLLDSDPARLWSADKFKEWIEKDLEKEGFDECFFMIETLPSPEGQAGRIVGVVGLEGIRWTHGDAWVGIGIGERESWNNGYGTDAMRLIQCYAFSELNLHRLSLTVFEYNPRAIRSYEKAGFVKEGRARNYLHRDGRRWDLIFMGFLREEWERRK